MIETISKSNAQPTACSIATRMSASLSLRFSRLPTSENRQWSRPSMATMVAKVPSGPIDRKSTRLNSSHTVIYTLSLHDALPIFGFAELAVFAAADQRKPPMVAAVDGDDGGEGAFRPDEDEAIGRPYVAQFFEAGAAEDHVGGVGQHRIAGERDAEPLAAGAAGAVAGDQIVGRDGFDCAGGVIDHLRRHAVVLFGKTHEFRAVAPRHMG